MIRGFYTAASGLYAHQNSLNVTANNIANVNTIGYKTVNASFNDLIYRSLERTEGNPLAQVGHGVKIAKTDLGIMEQGAMQPTDRGLDFAMVNAGDFFAVRDTASDAVSYTRAGNFIMSNEDGVFYLATSSGKRVLDADGADIEIEYDEDYNMTLTTADIGVYRFANPYGLEMIGENLYVATELSGEPDVADENGTAMKQGYLENSSVAISDEMVKIIESSKAFSFNSRMVQVADEIEQVVNSMR